MNKICAQKESIRLKHIRIPDDIREAIENEQLSDEQKLMRRQRRIQRKGSERN